MNLEQAKYIIVEIIPNYSKADRGFIVQISALKLEGLKLLDRFDYRLQESLILNEDLKKIVQYDKNSFTYVDDPSFMLEKFRSWVEQLPLLILEDSYTLDYLKDLPNSKELIYSYLNIEYSDDVFERIIRKYHLEPSAHLVDLLYEALIYESNSKIQDKECED